MINGNVEIVAKKTVYINNQNADENTILNSWKNLGQQNFDSDEFESLFDQEKHNFKIISHNNNFHPIIIRDVLEN